MPSNEIIISGVEKMDVMSPGIRNLRNLKLKKEPSSLIRLIYTLEKGIKRGDSDQ